MAAVRPGLIQATSLARMFTGKTETGYKFTTPKLRMRAVNPIYPPPGLSLRPPVDLEVETFCR